MTVITSEILKDRPEYEGSKRAIAGKTTGHLVLIERGITCQQAEQVLQGLEYSYSEFTVLSNTHRAKFTKKVFGRNLCMGTGGDKLSTGLFAACLAIFLGSDPVVMSGFSLSVSGHGYSDTVHLKRSHLESDRFALDYMSRKKLPVYAADEGFAGDSGLKLWKG